MSDYLQINLSKSVIGKVTVVISGSDFPQFSVKHSQVGPINMDLQVMAVKLTVHVPVAVTGRNA